MKLTKSQIKQLYSFTKEHYVEWYDVQTELVDHLANGIEEQLEQNTNLTFKSALNSEFKKFGVMGFSEVVKQKTNALNKLKKESSKKWLFDTISVQLVGFIYLINIVIQGLLFPNVNSTISLSSTS